MDMDERLDELANQPLTTRLLGYIKLTGPGYMQSAMTLGGGSVASCVLLGALLGYKLLWVQPLGMVLGYFVLAVIAKQACHSGERPYRAFWERLHPALAILWAVCSLIATVLWHIPQYSLAANGLRELASGIYIDLNGPVGSALVGAVLLVGACLVVRMYHSGAKGLRHFEMAVKILVWTIVFAFAVVAIATGIQWKRLFLGITGISFLRDIIGGAGMDERAIKPIVAGLAAATGINMLFLYPYSLLQKGWGKKHKELAYFDLLSGLVVPFLFATTFMVLAVANTVGPAEGEAGEVLKDIRAIVPVLGPTFGAWLGGKAAGDAVALVLIGTGMLAIGFSTIITHMLASGFIGCEMFGFSHSGKARWWFSLLPAVGVVGVFIRFPWWAAITASTLAAPLMPIAVLCFLVLLFKKSYMGTERPKGAMAAFWVVILVASVVIMSIAAYFGLQKNWQDLKGKFTPAPAETADAAPVEPEGETAPLVMDPIAETFSHTAMGTEFAFTLYTRKGDTGTDAILQIAEEAFRAVDALEARLSRWRPDSQVSYINNRAAREKVRIAPDVRDLLVLARDLHGETGGAFDVTVGPLIALWGFYAGEGRVPGDAELPDALAHVGTDLVELDAQARTVRFAKDGVLIDFGALGKGLALDHAVQVLRDYGVSSAVLHAGTSTVVALGAPPGESGWTVRIRDPYNREDYVDEAILCDESLSTSGSYEKFFEVDGKKYCHIFDPRTGKPVEGMLSATAIAGSGTMSDALSTSFFVMGEENVRAYCREHPVVRAVLVPLPADGVPQPRRINFPPEKEPL